MSKLPAVDSVWGVVGDTSTWLRVNSVDDMIKVSSFAGYVQWFNPRSHIFPPTGYVRIDSGITAIGSGGVDAEIRADNTQPFTVEWLCEIGGVKGRLAGQEVVQFHSKSYGAFSIDTWNFGYWKGESVPEKITTRGDVLAWLNVLGIVQNLTSSKRRCLIGRNAELHNKNE